MLKARIYRSTGSNSISAGWGSNGTIAKSYFSLKEEKVSSEPMEERFLGIGPSWFTIAWEITKMQSLMTRVAEMQRASCGYGPS